MLTPRSILFVDGENLVLRYQEMKTSGRIPDDKVVHIPDVFVWHPHVLTLHNLRSVVRVLYYTSVVGDDNRVQQVRREIAGNVFSSATDNGANEQQIVPIVFKKPAKSVKTRNVDIQVVIDVMRYAFTDEIDRVFLAAGDGDYLPLLTEVMRRGKQVEVLAFSSGLNQQLPHTVDRYSALDTPFFKPSDA